MVFGNTSGLHHLRHRSHEPQVNKRIWDRDLRKNTAYTPPSTSTENAPNGSILAELTPLDVESPDVSSDSQLRFFPSILPNHRSTPTTPAEESRSRTRLLDTGTINGLTLNRKGMAFTHLNPSSTVGSDDVTDTLSPSPDYPQHSPTTSMLGDSLTEDGNRPTLAITPPSSPSFNTPSVGSPSLAYSGRGTVKDASGTRRMMLKRKSSSFLRAASVSQSPT
jgi:hypothetical protein